jgi:HEAT repeat protein
VGLLVAHLHHHWHPDTREEAAWALAKYPQDWVIRVPVRAFSDPAEVVRDAATYALLQIGSSARDEVLKATTHPDSLIRHQAMETLTELDKKS